MSFSSIGSAPSSLSPFSLSAFSAFYSGVAFVASALPSPCGVPCWALVRPGVAPASSRDCGIASAVFGDLAALWSDFGLSSGVVVCAAGDKFDWSRSPCGFFLLLSASPAAGGAASGLDAAFLADWLETFGAPFVDAPSLPDFVFPGFSLGWDAPGAEHLVGAPGAPWRI